MRTHWRPPLTFLKGVKRRSLPRPGGQGLHAASRSPPVVFDRPYLLLVTDQATGEPLFLARVANPAAH
jgi:hypothetical protein